MTMFLKNRRFVLASAVAGGLVFPISASAATLNVMQTEAPRSMDPGDQTATYTAALLDPMYEGLLKRDPDLSLKPALATEWSSDAAGLVWTFKLRPGVKFHDGTPFDADVVVKNFARHLDTKRGLAASGRLRTFLEGVTAVDPMTVQFKLKSQYPAFLALLTTGPCLMVSPAAETAGTIGSKAVGTGPYKLAEYKSGEYVLQTKNGEWWGGAPKGEDEIKWTWTPEPSVMNMALQTGDADVINPFPSAFAQQVKANPENKLAELNTGNNSSLRKIVLGGTPGMRTLRVPRRARLGRIARHRASSRAYSGHHRPAGGAPPEQAPSDSPGRFTHR